MSFHTVRRAGTACAALFVIVAAALAVLLAAIPAAADPQDDKARVDRELAKTRAALESVSERVAAAAASLEEANRRLPAVERRLTDARADLAAVAATANAATKASKKAHAALTAAEKALAQAEARVEQTRDEIGAFAASAYMGRDVAGIDALLSVEDPADFVAGLTYLEQIADVQRLLLDNHTAARGAAVANQNTRTERKRAADEAKLAADLALRRAAAAEAEAARAEQEVASVVAQREDALRVAARERAATEARYKELQEESERIAAEIRGLATGSGPVLRAGTKLLMPVNGWKTSNFGMRFDPFYHVWRLHAGVDVAAPGGAPIWAAESGRVFRAGWNGGYGNYTCIYHGAYQGKGFATCYAHQSFIGVKVNQQVRRGQVIGRIGTTGASTGNHLHFEVRLDGNPTNPVPWLPACLC